MQYRQGEAGKTLFRMERIFAIGPEYFISTREGDNLGPFRSRPAAERGLQEFLIDMKNKRRPVILKAKISNDIWQTSNYR